MTIVVAATVGGCSSRGQTIAAVPPIEANLVAPFGDSQAQLLAMADQARALGKQPVFTTVKAPSRPYHFPAYAQVLQTSDLLVVRGYGRVYVYPKSSAQVFFGSSAVPLDSLPAASVPALEKIAAGKTARHFTSGDIKHKEFLCPDCTAVVGYPRNVQRVSATLNGKLDPWQVSPRYVPFTAKAPASTAVSLAQRRTQGMFSCYGGGSSFTSGGSSGGTGGEWGGGSSNCSPSFPSYPIIYIYYAGCYCTSLTSLLSSARKTDAVRAQSAERVAKLDSAIAAHSIADDQIDANIDARIPAHVRELARTAMERMPAYARQHVAGVAEDGTFFANRIEDYEAHARAGKWQQIRGNVWKDVNGEIVTVPDIWAREKQASGERRTSTVSCPPPGSQSTGGYVRGYQCNTGNSGYAASVDASRVGGMQGSSWCLEPGEDGYLLLGAWSNATNDGAEAGLKWSVRYLSYQMFATDRAGGIQDIPNTYSFPPGTFRMFWTNLGSNWMITVAGPGSTRTWVYSKASSAGSGSSWTYKQGTFLAQDQQSLNDGSFFGVDAYTGLPLFSWSGAPGHDYFPDPTRAIRIGDLYGVNLHS